MYVDDMAVASVFVMGLDVPTYDHHAQSMQSHINVGFGSDVTIGDLAKAVGEAVGYQGKIGFDASKPNALRKWMDSGRLNGLGWYPQITLELGLKNAYSDFLRLKTK